MGKEEIDMSLQAQYPALGVYYVKYKLTEMSLLTLLTPFVEFTVGKKIL